MDAGKSDAGSPENHPLQALEHCPHSVLDAFTLDAIKPPAANSQGYVLPDAGTLNAAYGSVAALLRGDAVAAVTLANAARYRLCRGTGGEADLALWAPIEPGFGQAVFAWRSREARPAIIEAPHPVFDQGTLEESVVVFRQINARVLLTSGTHRCANSQVSSCDGVTSACDGVDAPFRESDMAHTTDSVFHAAHRAFSEIHASDWIFSIHGMAGSGISVSDGTTSPTSIGSPSARLARELGKTFTNVSTCNAFDGGQFEARLCATTNVQGRHLNLPAASDACTLAASASGGRFIHLEQSITVRARAAEVAAAIGAVVP
jgi:hypothetical protein